MVPTLSLTSSSPSSVLLGLQHSHGIHGSLSDLQAAREIHTYIYLFMFPKREMCKMQEAKTFHEAKGKEL